MPKANWERFRKENKIRAWDQKSFDPVKPFRSRSATFREDPFPEPDPSPPALREVKTRRDPQRWHPSLPKLKCLDES